jgi:hypothetical protein
LKSLTSPGVLASVKERISITSLLPEVALIVLSQLVTVSQLALAPPPFQVRVAALRSLPHNMQNKNRQN